MLSRPATGIARKFVIRGVEVVLMRVWRVVADLGFDVAFRFSKSKW